MTAKRILIVDDEVRIREVVQFALEREGFVVTHAGDVESARSALSGGSFDVLILDVTLPDGDGLSLCREIRRSTSIPIVFLSARGEEIDRVLGLELGGDDYLSKPFSPRELVARVRAILRRAAESKERAGTNEHVTCGPIALDAARHQARCGATQVPLTRTEFALLHTLLLRPGIVYSRAQLMQRAYAYDNLITERTIDTHVKRIRSKFRALGVDPIATVHGVGYKANEL